MRRLFHRFVLRRTWVAFVVMGLSFFGFGVGTLNLFMLFKANAELFESYGWQAVEDGGLRQLVELLVSGYVSLLFYILFKACEFAVVRGVTEPPREST